MGRATLFMQNGTPMARVYLHPGPGGRPSKSFPGMTMEQARAAAEEWERSQPWYVGMGSGPRITDLLSDYIRALEAQRAPVNTISTYRSCLGCYVEPYIGHMDAKELRPYQVESLYNVLMLQGARHGGGISPNTVEKLHGFLQGAFDWLVRMGAVEENPIRNVSRPRHVGAETVAFTAEQLNDLMDALELIMSDMAVDKRSARRRAIAFAAYLSVSTGMRCGEVCGLSRTDADLAAGRLHIGHTAVARPGGGVVRQTRPKNRSSVRNISIDSSVCDAVRDHEAWTDLFIPHPRPSMPLVTLDGTWMRPGDVSRAFTKLRKELGLPDGTSFHTLRHTHATWLLMSGVDIRTIQERLGHARIETTLAIYSHVLPGRDAAAARVFAQAAWREGADER